MSGNRLSDEDIDGYANLPGRFEYGIIRQLAREVQQWRTLTADFVSSDDLRKNYEYHKRINTRIGELEAAIDAYLADVDGTHVAVAGTTYDGETEWCDWCGPHSPWPCAERQALDALKAVRYGQ